MPEERYERRSARVLLPDRSDRLLIVHMLGPVGRTGADDAGPTRTLGGSGCLAPVAL